jgi:hypothetical protein
MPEEHPGPAQTLLSFLWSASLAHVFDDLITSLQESRVGTLRTILITSKGELGIECERSCDLSRMIRNS